MKTLLYSILWILAGVVLFYSANALGLSYNLFSWNPTFDWVTALNLAVIVAVEASILWLTRKTKPTSVAIVSLFVCIALAAVGAMVFITLQNETVSQGGEGFASLIVNRRTLSPIWYRIVFPMIYFIPLFSWTYRTYKHQIKSRKANQSSEPTSLNASD